MTHTISAVWVFLDALTILLGLPVSRKSFQMLQPPVGTGHKMQGFKITYSDIEPPTSLSSQLHITWKGWRQPSTLRPLGYLLFCPQAQKGRGTFWQLLVGTRNLVLSWVTFGQPQYPNSNLPLKDVQYIHIYASESSS